MTQVEVFRVQGTKGLLEQAHDMTCDRKFWCHEKARNLHHAHTTKALAVPPLLAAMGYEPAKGGWELRPNARNFY